MIPTDRRKFIKSAAATALAACTTSVLGDVPKRPNILIVFSDQLSFDAMSSRIGSRYLKTPNLDALAAKSICFPRAYAANPLCIPSRTSMFTGRYPVETGIQTNEKSRLDATAFPCLGTRFRDAGYRTGYFGKWHLPYSVKDVSVTGFEEMASEMVDVDTANHVTEFMGRRHDAPFLAVASFLNPHNICEWARGDALNQGDIGPPPPANQCPPLRANHGLQIGEPDIMTLMRRSYQSNPMFPVGGWGDAKWRQYEWAYYRLIEKMDAFVGKITQCLVDKNLAKDTLVVFLADHGDCQGAHHWNQKTVFYEESARVPLLLSYAGKIKPGTSDQLVNTGIDLLPTLCDFAGISLPNGLHGSSLRRIATDHSFTLNRPFIVTSNHMAQGAPINGVLSSPQGRMLRTERHKYCIYSEGQHRESLVDLMNDPGEMKNLASDPNHRTVLKEHRETLRRWGANLNDNFPYSMVGI